MLESVGRKTSHSRQTTVTITSSHAKASVVQAAMQELTWFFKELALTAEQLEIVEKVVLIAMKAYSKILPVLTPNEWTQITPSSRLTTGNYQF